MNFGEKYFNTTGGGGGGGGGARFPDADLNFHI